MKNKDLVFLFAVYIGIMANLILWYFGAVSEMFFYIFNALALAALFVFTVTIVLSRTTEDTLANLKHAYMTTTKNVLLELDINNFKTLTLVYGSEKMNEVVNQLKLLCLERVSSKETLEAKHIKWFDEVSDEKCFYPEKARYSQMYTAIKPFLDEEIIKNNLSKNATICFNPYMLLNYPDKDCPLIFQPSKELLEQYSFIKRRYSWASRVVVYYYIDADEYKAFRSGDIVVETKDILELNLRYLHPFHRGVIQQNNFNLLIK